MRCLVSEVTLQGRGLEREGPFIGYRHSDTTGQFSPEGSKGAEAVQCTTGVPRPKENVPPLGQP